MRIILAAATPMEIQPCVDFIKSHWASHDQHTFTRGEISVLPLITGVGMMRAAFALTHCINQFNPDLCIQAGIAGAFPGKFNIGDVVHVVEEKVIDLGAENAEGNFISMAEVGIEEDFEFINGLENPTAGKFNFLPTARGITVNTVHGNADSISAIINKYNPDVESMEGAALFYCCLKIGGEFMEIRAVSNIVEPRDKSKWDISGSVEKLNGTLIEILNELSQV